ncbi:MAG: cytochrome c [Rhodocyclaceae bacterium]|nr:cytochrome c [Rhodocyclaceae bacterium]MBX3670953.1 cytochrome c [Rhodocyclaceae bacterium]
MKNILLGGVAAIVAALIVAYGMIWAGAISFAADEPHSDDLTRLIGWARERAIAKASADISAPHNLSDPERIRHGAGNYDAMCADCHLTPGAEESEIRKGLYPVPPNLSLVLAGADSEHADARRFWIIKHGIKGSGMAAWSRGGMDDEAIWNLVAFLRQLPQLSKPAYAELVAHSGGHSHSGLGQDEHEPPSRPAALDEPASSEVHHPHTHDHAHERHSH